jgi:hypothetical protein
MRYTLACVLQRLAARISVGLWPAACIGLLPALLGSAALATAADWQPMFDGKSLGDRWRVAAFARHPEIRVENGAIILTNGAPLSGVNYTGTFPKTNYEVRFEASRMKGNDFFASLTAPAGESFITLVTGGWGGDIVGLSSIDGWDASENETRTYFNFEPNRWYALRLRVTPDKISAWIDDQQVVNVSIAGRELSLRPGDIKLSAPFGFASYNTMGAVRNVEFRTFP